MILSYDGLMIIYGVENQAAPGYKRRTVGIRRHYAALNAGARVDLLLRTWYRPEVSVQDVAVLPLLGKQYRITLIQVPENMTPPVMDLTLERLERDYDMSG